VAESTSDTTTMKKILFVLLALPLAAHAAGEHQKLDPAPINTRDVVSIQRGVQVFVNYCLSCHSAHYMRYNRLLALGLTEEQIRDNLMFGEGKLGDTMTVAMRRNDAKQWFGVAPPDLSVIARSRGADWLYTYFRSYYHDDSTATGWNNLVFPNVAMPHVLWDLQGQQALEVKEEQGPHGKHAVSGLVLAKPGTLARGEYDKVVADLVNYLVFMAEPDRAARVRLGYLVLIALGVLFALFYLLKREYWKDIH
jgi:ubiquinol-cytochrome c reductase cytochrome c1 subunit